MIALHDHIEAQHNDALLLSVNEIHIMERTLHFCAMHQYLSIHS